MLKIGKIEFLFVPNVRNTATSNPHYYTDASFWLYLTQVVSGLSQSYLYPDILSVDCRKVVYILALKKALLLVMLREVFDLREQDIASHTALARKVELTYMLLTGSL